MAIQEKRPRALNFDILSENGGVNPPSSKKEKQVRVWVDGW